MSEEAARTPSAGQVALGSIEGFVAFGFGSGLSRWAPGTSGTLAAVPLAMALVQLPFWLQSGMVAIAFLAGIPLTSAIARRLGNADPGGIVWDEMVGFWLVAIFLPWSWPWWVAAFLLFRLFDITKPWPISLAERHCEGGFGIMFDDLLAAVWALLVLAGAQWLLATL